MSAYEWVIEQESADGVTTRIVFDFADSDVDSATARDAVGEGPTRGRAHAASYVPQQHHRRDGRGRGTVTAKDAAIRSDGGSSRRSSKHSNGSRSRLQCPHHAGTRARGGLHHSNGSSGVGSAVGGSVYSAAALRQRYQRLLFGGGRGVGTAAVAGAARSSSSTTWTTDAVAPLSATAVADPQPRRVDPASATQAETCALCSSSSHLHTRAGPGRDAPPPSTLFMSAYGAEVADDEEDSHGSAPYAVRRGCQHGGRNSDSIGSGVDASGSVSVGAEGQDEAAPPPPPPLARPRHRGSNTGEPLYVLRDVWAARATCPGSLATSTTALEFPAFPPLHPIDVEDAQASTSPAPRRSPQSSHRHGGDDDDADTTTAAAPDTHQHMDNVFAGKEGRQRRGRGQRLAGPPSVDSASSSSSTSCRWAEPQRDRGRGAQRRGAAAGDSRRPGRSEGEAVSVAAVRGLRGDASAFDAGEDSGDASEEVDSCSATGSSLECRSMSSSDDSDARELCADAVFAATVQSLAGRAERERKRLEARERRRLRNESALSEEAVVVRAPACTGSGAVASFFISPIHQSVAAESAAWTAGTGVRFLGHGGLGTTSAASPAAPMQRRLGPGRRRGRSVDVEEDREGEEEAEGGGGVAVVANAVRGDGVGGGGGALMPPPVRSDPPCNTRTRKRRKRGDRVQQSVVGECGGSRALRPVAAPTVGPPTDMLPCSRADMRVDVLESLLMEVVLSDDHFHLT
ncbi:hypothetical protein NESM_000529700 [Novymonas esmeraldas]|uniref:Uncharacterized protein n=1 Tax=Novymonas esmeraldas TaxID=1808958 RepID=A0AAW0ESJ5_9TRYP